MVDFHSHVLPGIDDGSGSVEESLQMLRMAARQGVTHVVATPHFYPRYDDLTRFLARRDRAEKALRAAMEPEPGLPELIVGAEVYFFRGISESEVLDQLTIREKRCILIEMPHSPWSEDHYRELDRIWHKRGILPIIAHVDRYIAPLRTHGIPGRLAQLPVLVQANAEFFLQRSTAGLAFRLLKADQIQLLGSDCHNLTDRSPNLGPAMELIRRKLGEGAVESLQRYEYTVVSKPRNNE